MFPHPHSWHGAARCAQWPIPALRWLVRCSRHGRLPGWKALRKSAIQRSGIGARRVWQGGSGRDQGRADPGWLTAAGPPHLPAPPRRLPLLAYRRPVLARGPPESVSSFARPRQKSETCPVTALPRGSPFSDKLHAPKPWAVTCDCPVAQPKICARCGAVLHKPSASARRAPRSLPPASAPAVQSQDRMKQAAHNHPKQEALPRVA
jgi:hypothetical protein